LSATVQVSGNASPLCRFQKGSARTFFKEECIAGNQHDIPFNLAQGPLNYLMNAVAMRRISPCFSFEEIDPRLFSAKDNDAFCSAT